MEEIWKDIKGYEGMYQVSNLGRVKSLERVVKCISSRDGYSKRPERILRAGVASNGYLMVALYKDKKQECKTLHRLVAEYFIDNPNNLPCVNHKNGIRTDNSIENLEWVTYSENNYHAVNELGRVAPWKGKFGANAPRSRRVRQLTKDGEVVAEFVSAREAAKSINSSQGRISDCCRGEKPHHKGFIWEYIDG